jgi:hypothetical protein
MDSLADITTVPSGCFHCDPMDPEIFAEVTALGEPMSEIESTFILEQCFVSDLEVWTAKLRVKIASQFNEGEWVDTKSETVSLAGETDTVGAELEKCHLCGTPFS